MEITSLVRKNILKLKPYSSARDEFQGEASVFLDANENPNPSPYNRYPDPLQKDLKKKIAELKNVSADQVFLGNGSDEAIDLLFRAFCEPSVDNVVIPQPTYGMYSVSANINNVAIKSPQLTPNFELDLDLINAAIDEQTKLIFICSPNNPSGNLLSRNKILELLKNFKGLVVVDEAYIDFTDQPSFTELLPLFPNLVVLQTLSKAWGLAAIRLGMCFANEGVIQVLNKIKPPYNISILTQEVALQQLGDTTHKDQWVKEILNQREYLVRELSSVPAVQKVYPSDANFILVKIPHAKQVYQKLIAEGIVVRDRSSVILCNDCLRITVGTASENQKLINSVKAIISK